MNKQLEDKLNIFLANQLVNYVKLHDMHWYVRGNAFFTLHTKLEELYDQSATILDDVAERILALKGKPVASLKEALKIATIKEMESGYKSGEVVVKELITDTAWWIKDLKEIITLAEENNDGATADIFNDYLREYEKLAWMLEAYNN